MRFSLAGILILLLLASGGLIRSPGSSKSVGIQNHIRPDCWNPLIINLTSQISDPMTYEVQVWQEDLDKDHVVYTREITLSPKLQEKFEVYFVPGPTVSVRDFRGLPALPDPATAGDLQKAMQVRLCLPQAPGKNRRTPRWYSIGCRSISWWTASIRRGRLPSMKWARG